jgi:hypothetical protein
MGTTTSSQEVLEYHEKFIYLSSGYIDELNTNPYGPTIKQLAHVTVRKEPHKDAMYLKYLPDNRILVMGKSGNVRIEVCVFDTKFKIIQGTKFNLTINETGTNISDMKVVEKEKLIYTCGLYSHCLCVHYDEPTVKIKIKPISELTLSNDLHFIKESLSNTRICRLKSFGWELNNYYDKYANKLIILFRSTVETQYCLEIQQQLDNKWVFEKVIILSFINPYVDSIYNIVPSRHHIAIAYQHRINNNFSQSMIEVFVKYENKIVKVVNGLHPDFYDQYDMWILEKRNLLSKIEVLNKLNVDLLTIILSYVG